MKLSIIIMLLVVSCYSARAQETIQDVKLNIDLLNNLQSVQVRTAARVIQKTSAVWYDTTWLYSTRNRISYRTDGTVDQEFEDVFGKSAWEDYNRWNYQYDQSDLLQTIIGERFNFSAWDSLEFKQHTYYGDGKLNTIKRSVYTYPGWYPTQRELYEYNAEGLVDKQFFQQPISETEWYYTYLFETTYTPNGQVAELIGYSSETGDSVWTLSYKLRYLYDQDDIQTEEVFSVYIGGNDPWLPSSRNINTISNGKITETVSQADYGSGWEDTERELLEYDEKGNLASIRSQQYKDGTWQNTRLRVFEYDPASAIASPPGPVQDYFLSDNYPNPFNPQTTIRFAIPKAGFVNLTVYNVLGQAVAVLLDKTMAAGEYGVSFDAGNLPTGIYFYRLRAENFEMIKRMTLIK